MKEANEKAFENLMQQFPDEVTISSGIRWFSTNDNEKEWLKNSTILSRKNIAPRSICGLVNFQDESYLVTTGFRFNDYTDELFEQSAINAGLFTLLLSEDFFRIKKNNLTKFKDILEITKENYDEYSGHDYNSFFEFLEPVYIFKLASDSVIPKDNIYQQVGYLCTKNVEFNITLEFDSMVIEGFNSLFLEPLNSISHENLLSALISVKFSNSFLELYRNIEMLFPISYLDELSQSVGSQIKFKVFWESIEDKLKWKPKEEDSLDKLCSFLNDEIKNKLFEIYPGDLNRTLSNSIYKIRNGIVHFRLSSNQIEFSDSQWNKLIEICIDLNLTLYKKYEHLLTQS